MKHFRPWLFSNPQRLRPVLSFSHGAGGLPIVLKQCSSTESARPALTLRPYQEEAIQAVLDYLKRGERRLGLSLATGAGKTVIFSQLIGRIEPSSAKATKTLILVHRRELVEQAARHCRTANPDKTIEIEMGKQSASGSADITVGSVQTLVRGDRLSKFDPSCYKLILVDEAHHIVANAYLTILRHFGLIPDVQPGSEKDPNHYAGEIEEQDIHSDIEQRVEPPVKRLGPMTASVNSSAQPISQLQNPSTTALVGVSATLSRFDGLSLGHAIDHVVYHKDYIDLIDEKWLSDMMFSTVASKAQLSHVKSNKSGDFVPGPLSEAMNTPEVKEATVKAWLAKAKDRKSTLAFCVDVAHAEGLMSTFREHGIDARMVTGATTTARRVELIEAFRNQQYPVLINVGVFTEGTDIPNIDCVLLARPTKSRNLLVQMIGRGMRLFPDKETCHVIDLVSSLQSGITTVPTLFGLDPTVLVEKASPSDMLRAKQSPELLSYINGQVPSHVVSRLKMGSGNLNFKDYDSILDFVGDTSNDTHIRRLSNNAWIHVGSGTDDASDRHVLSGSDQSYLTIHDLGDDASPLPRFKVTLTAKVPTQEDDAIQPWKRRPHPWARSRTIAKSETLSGAVSAADTWANKASTFPRYLVDRYQGWRSKPANKKQLELLDKLLGHPSDFDPSSYTMGQCGETITKLKFGAKGHYVAALHRKARDLKGVKRARELEQRQTVKVGPISKSV